MCFSEELVGWGGSVEKRKCGVAVKFCVHWILAVKNKRRRSWRSKRKGGGQETKSAVKKQRRRSWRSWCLHEPFAGNKIFEKHNTCTSLEYHREVAALGQARPWLHLDDVVETRALHAHADLARGAL